MWPYFSIVSVVLVLIIGQGDFVTVSTTTIAVNRRENTDLVYYQNESSHQNCDTENPSTHLVIENTCTENANLFNGKACMHKRYNMPKSIHFYHDTVCPFAMGDSDQLHLSVNIQNGALKINTSTNATAILKMTRQPLNGSCCYISSLEVYRGSSQAIVISHDGFSLDNSGNIEVCITIILLFLIIVQQSI